MSRFSRLLWLVLLAGLLALPAAAQARAAREQQRIDHLIAEVGRLDKAVFIRNGDEHQAKEAAAHLRKKLDYAGDRIATAEQFIDKAATASWFSRKKYTIRFADGRTVEAAAWLRVRLKAFDAAQIR